MTALARGDMDMDKKFIDAYWKFRNREIASLRALGVELGHCSYYHKCIYAKAAEYESSDQYKEDLKEQLKKNPYLRGEISTKDCFKEKSRGRKGEKGTTPEFKEVYWKYENYEITPVEAYEMTGYSKNWFHKVSLDYEKLPWYPDELAQHPEVMDKPSRTRAVPQGFREDMSRMSDEQLAQKYGVHVQCISRLKMKTDKKAVWGEIQKARQGRRSTAYEAKAAEA